VTAACSLKTENRLSRVREVRNRCVFKLPFGEELGAGTGGRTTAQGYSASDGVRQQFTQYERDNETGLDFAEARYYSNTQGRFTRPDPYNVLFEMKAGRNARERAQILDAYIWQPQNWNRYTYCLDNPTNLYDPSGLTWVWDNNEQILRGLIMMTTKRIRRDMFLI
jgi:RHS repeat-associated protein